MNRLEAVLRRTDFVARMFYIAGAMCLCALFLLMFGDIAGRFLFNSPIKGTTEVSEYLLVAIVFLALGFAQLTGTHVRVEVLLSRLPSRLQSIMNIFVLLLLIAFVVIMMLKTGERAYICWSEKILLPLTTVKLPIWWPSFIGTIGCALLTISFLTQIVRNTIGLITGKVVGFKTWTR